MTVSGHDEGHDPEFVVSTDLESIDHLPGVETGVRPEDEGESGELSPSRLAWKRFLSNKLAVAGLVILSLLVLLSVFLPMLMTLEPNIVDAAQFRKGPSDSRLLGSDSAGRDVFARLVYGGRVSLMVGLSAAFSATFIGMALGAVAGFFGGIVDGFISRVTDVVLSFPTVVIIIIVAAFAGPSLKVLILSIALFEWPTACRLVRGLTLSLREQESVVAARGLGGRSLHILRRHIVPATIAPLTVVATLLVAQAILLEAALSFLGLGVPPPTASWGNMLTEAQSLTILESMPWLWIPPGAAIAVAVLAVNFVGDGLREMADPRQQR